MKDALSPAIEPVIAIAATGSNSSAPEGIRIDAPTISIEPGMKIPNIGMDSQNAKANTSK